MRSSLLNIFTFVLTSFAAHALPSLKLPLPLEMRHFRYNIEHKMSTTVEVVGAKTALRINIELRPKDTLLLDFDLRSPEEGRRLINLQSPQVESVADAATMALRAAFEVIGDRPSIRRLEVRMNPLARKKIEKALSIPNEFPRSVKLPSVPLRRWYPALFGAGASATAALADWASLELRGMPEPYQTEIALYSIGGMLAGAGLGFVIKAIANWRDRRNWGIFVTEVEVDLTIRERIMRVLDRGDQPNVLWVLNPCEANAQPLYL